MLFQIKSRFSAAVVAEVEITCHADASDSTKLGRAVATAVSNRADLSGADLSGADLSGADLGGADLGGADLRSANLSGANLSGANLYGANLYGANLGRADLYGANLGRADLSGADLSGADLGGADLGGAVSKVKQMVSAVQRSDGYMFFGFVKDDSSLVIVAGCQNRTLESYRQHIKADYPGRGDSAALMAETTDILDFMEKRHAALVK